MRIIAAGSVVVLMVLAIFWVSPAPVADLDSKACDLLTGWAGPGKESGHVVIVEIDEESLGRFGRWPWPETSSDSFHEAFWTMGLPRSSSI